LRQIPWIEIYGSDYPTPDGTAIRDYIHVTDLAEAHVKALMHLLEERGSTALNLGTGRGYSVREVIEAVEEVSGKSIPVRRGPRRVGDPPILVADPIQAEKALKWQPQRSDLRTIINTSWNWYSTHRW
jgi:UDP-glucose 4-epimerase